MKTIKFDKIIWKSCSKENERNLIIKITVINGCEKKQINKKMTKFSSQNPFSTFIVFFR
jgi:hypothetical protein